MNFFGIGTGEILVILIIAVLVVGPERMVEFARDAGKMLATLRRMSQDVKSEFREAFDFDLDEVRDTFDLSDVRDALEMDPKKAKPAVPADSSGKEEAPAPAAVAAAGATAPSEPAPAANGSAGAQAAQKPSSPAMADDEPVDIMGTQLVPEDEDVEAVQVNEVLVIQDEAASEQAEPVSEQAQPVSEQTEPVSEQTEPVSEQTEPVSGDGLHQSEESAQ